MYNLNNLKYPDLISAWDILERQATRIAKHEAINGANKIIIATSLQTLMAERGNV